MLPSTAVPRQLPTRPRRPGQDVSTCKDPAFDDVLDAVASGAARISMRSSAWGSRAAQEPNSFLGLANAALIQINREERAPPTLSGWRLQHTRRLVANSTSPSSVCVLG